MFSPQKRERQTGPIKVRQGFAERYPEYAAQFERATYAGAESRHVDQWFHRMARRYVQRQTEPITQLSQSTDAIPMIDFHSSQTSSQTCRHTGLEMIPTMILSNSILPVEPQTTPPQAHIFQSYLYVNSELDLLDLFSEAIEAHISRFQNVPTTLFMSNFLLMCAMIPLNLKNIYNYKGYQIGLEKGDDIHTNDTIRTLGYPGGAVRK